MEVEAGKHGAEEGVAAPSTLLLAGPRLPGHPGPLPSNSPEQKDRLFERSSPEFEMRHPCSQNDDYPIAACCGRDSAWVTSPPWACFLSVNMGWRSFSVHV